MELRDQVVDSTYYVRQRSGGDRFCDDWEASSIFSATRLICKVLKEPDLRYGRTELKRFKESIRKLVGVSHDGVEKAIALGTHEGHTFFLLESLPFQTIDAFMEEPEPVPVQDSLRIAIRIARALTYMHSRGVPHGHLHPGLIHVQTNYDGVSLLKISKFYLSAYQALAGKAIADLTPEPYMAPAILLDAENDPAVSMERDVYAFGLLLFWLLTGVTFTERGAGERGGATLPAHNRPIPSALGTVVFSCLDISNEQPSPRMETILNDLIHISINFQTYLSEDGGRFVPAQTKDLAVVRNTSGVLEPQKRRQKGDPKKAPEKDLKKAPRKTRKKAPRSTRTWAARSPGESISALEALHPHFPGLEREVLYFKRLLYDLYIPRGNVYLIVSSHIAATEKRRWLGYFEDLVSYSRGATLTIPGRARNNDLLHGLIGALLRFRSSLRQPARRRFSSEFRRRFASRRAFLAALNPEILEIFGFSEDRLVQSSPESERGAEVFEQIIHFIIERYRPLLMVLDDVGMLDRPSLRLLERSAELISDLPVLIVGILR